MIDKQPSQPKPPKSESKNLAAQRGVSLDQFGNTSMSGLISQQFTDGNQVVSEPGGTTTIYVIQNGMRMRMDIEPDRTLTQEFVSLCHGEC